MYSVNKTEKTYAWITDTANSKVKSNNWTNRTIDVMWKYVCTAWFPNSVISKCPAIMFAINRTARVKGRIILLIVSINTINGIKVVGVLWGVKCANIYVVWLIHPNNIKDAQNGSAKDIVIDMCLVELNTYGNKPVKFLNKIK